MLNKMKALKNKMYFRYLGALAFMMATPLGAFAQSTDVIKNASVTSDGKALKKVNITLPFERFLLTIVDALTGPLPMLIGILALVGAAAALFSGNAGEGTKKILMIVIAVSIMLQAPTLMNWVSEGAGGAVFVF